MIVKTKHLTAFLALLPLLLCGCAKLRPEIAAVRDEVAKKNILEGSKTGYAGIEGEQWKRYIKLSSMAHTKELKLLTDDPNPVVRVYAFQALVERKEPEVYSILLDHLTDNEEVTTFYGCIVSPAKVGDELLEIAASKRVNTSDKQIKEKFLSDQQLAEINHQLIINSKIKLQARANLLFEMEPEEKYYRYIHQMALRKEEPAALVALSRFQKQKDVSLIKEMLTREDFSYHALRAAVIFPDEAFYPVLVKLFHREWQEKLYDYARWRVLIEALSRYPRADTLALFEKIVTTNDPFRHDTLSKYLIDALKKHPDAFYAELIKRIKHGPKR